ncbi:MAG: hypothetical protein EOP81_04750 [Variovorax sp.]|nr:MAG: hypothetical protein EOP81_04750 [Variovorax sp.]
MIISPPFLSQPNVPVYDEQCVRDVMPGGIVGSGAFPVSQAMAWHGGIHIHATNADEPVRAIADGTVIFSRTAGNARYDGQDNSTGCVVIRHKTEIGADGTTPVEVVFYSVYQHLRRLDPALPAVNQPVYRKDRLGSAGSIHGQVNRIHLEIIAGDADTLKLVGRSRGDLGTAQDGRSTVVFGRIYVLVPSGSAFYAAQPTGATLPAAAGTTTEELVVALDYNAGNATFSTYKPSGGDPLFTLPAETGAEYSLYTEANARHARHTAGSSPSGWYELLRFGRNLGSDPLPADAPHWRKAGAPGHPNGVWLDLNGAGTRKFSDGDMPHWAGWKLVDDDTQDDNSQCNSAMIDAMLAPPAQTVPQAVSPPNLTSPPVPAAQSPETAQTTPEQKATSRKQNLCKPAVQESLARTICKFPTEWAKREVRSRWEWTRKRGNPYMPYPLEDEADFTEMADFAQKLCFWEELPEEDQTRLTKKHWHFHPREFIIHFKKCGWLSVKEMAQCFPRDLKHLTGSQFSSHNFGWTDAEAQSTAWSVHFNKSNRKYGLDQQQRLVHYFAQVIPETGYMRLMKESDSKDGSYLKGKAYYPYYGRGLIQLTWAANYQKYGQFRAFRTTEVSPATYHEAGWNVDTLLVTSNSNYNAANCADSAGCYIAGYAGMVGKMDAGISVEDCIAVSRCVNGNVAVQNINGLDGRLQSVLVIRDVLLDLPAEATSEIMRFTWRRNSQQEATGKLNKQGKPVKAFIARLWDLEISLAKQRPR